MVYRAPKEKSGLAKIVDDLGKWLKFFLEVPEPQKKSKGSVVWNS